MKCSDCNDKKSPLLLGIMGAVACVTAALVMPSVINKTSSRIYKMNNRKNNRHSRKKER